MNGGPLSSSISGHKELHAEENTHIAPSLLHYNPGDSETLGLTCKQFMALGKWLLYQSQTWRVDLGLEAEIGELKADLRCWRFWWSRRGASSHGHISVGEKTPLSRSPSFSNAGLEKNRQRRNWGEGTLGRKS